MLDLKRDKETICAVSTAQGMGGIAVIRVSGSASYSYVKKLCPFLPDKPESHQIYYGHLIDSQTSEHVDEVLVSYFKRGRSFTGEETLEISCHGSPVLCEEILSLLVESGCRLAEKGEFTYRAFMNQRIDLVQAESILSLIESQSKKAARLSLRQLQGDLSSQLNEIENILTLALAHLEANIDFASEDIEIESSQSLLKKIRMVKSQVNSLVQQSKASRYLNDGLKVGIFGKPNVGKSSFLNAILKEEKAIVSDIAGTTRDFVEGRMILNQTPVQFVDTAGLRKPNDKIEAIGIKRSHQLSQEVDLCFLLFELNKPVTGHELVSFSHRDPEDIYIIGNKLDLVAQSPSPLDLKNQLVEACLGTDMAQRDMVQFIKQIPDKNFVVASAKRGQGISLILESLTSYLKCQFSENSTVLINNRHTELLRTALISLDKSEVLLDENESPEFVCSELIESLKSIREVLGKTYDDEVMDRVFKEFCLGK